MAYESKRALLEHLGKNPDDRKLINRMIERWEVYEEWGMYYLVSEERGEKKEEKKSETSSTVDNGMDELRKQHEKVVSDYNELIRKYNKLLDMYKEEAKKAEWWLYDHLIFFYNKFIEYRNFVDRKTFGQAEHNKRENGTQDTKETVRDEVYKRYNFVYGEDEKNECKIVEEIINQKQKEIAELPF